jgi:GT2 family glycosyltransferase
VPSEFAALRANPRDRPPELVASFTREAAESAPRSRRGGPYPFMMPGCTATRIWLVSALDLGLPTAIMRTRMHSREHGTRRRRPGPHRDSGRRPGVEGCASGGSVSVVIPCRSADALVPGLLDPLCVDPACREVLVVVNGGPPEETDLFGPSVRMLWLAEPGLSRAKNLGLAEAQSQIVAFLDDDTVPDEGWCASLAAAFGRHPTATVIGGPIRLAEEVDALMLGPEGRGYLGELDLGTEETQCEPWRYPYGGNSAVRGGAARAAGGFAEDFGYSGQRLLPNEELDLFRRMESAGGEVWYTPAAGVTHLVRADRASLRYLVYRAFWKGIGDRRMAKLHSDLPVLGRARALLLALQWTAAAAVRAVQGQRANAVDHVLRVAKTFGWLWCG